MRDPFAPSRRHRLGLAAAVGGGVALVAAVVAGLGADQGWPVDRQVRRTLEGRRHPRIRAAMRIAGAPGAVGVYVPATLIIASVIRYNHDIKRTVPGIATVGAAALASLALKRVVRRERPAGESGPSRETHSFPSGHATRATAMALMGAYLLVRERIVPAEVAMPAAAAIALITGASRAYADAHWTTDVIGGWALGAAAAAGGALWYEHLRADAHDDA
jgi:membrane-associated phospholipid phosphatase